MVARLEVPLAGQAQLLVRLGDFAGWFDVLHGDIDPPELSYEDRALVREGANVAETLDWSAEPWKALTEALKASTGAKGKSLFLPLRLALTGRESGPEMAGVLAAMEKDRAVARLRAAAKRCTYS